jgi:predicted PurR-regulated permease PerM
VGLCLVLDAILDNIIVPKFHGDTLGLHPAAVLVAALIAAQLIGFVGLVLAAPVLATMVLISRYFLRKLMDQDPWPSSEDESQNSTIPWNEIISRLFKGKQKNTPVE